MNINAKYGYGWGILYVLATHLMACSALDLDQDDGRVGEIASKVGAGEFWTNISYAMAIGNTLTRDPGNGDYAGASSVQQIIEGDGFVEFSTNETNRAKVAGLGQGDEFQNVGDIDYGIYLTENGDVWIYENGWFQGVFGGYQAGDMFRVETFNNQVRYRKNGEVFHSSLMLPTYPLGLDTSLIHEGGTITAARVVSCTNEVNCMPQEMWKNVRYATSSGSALTRDPGNGDYAGASSVQQIIEGDGFVEFSTNETNRAKVAGLGHGDEFQNVGDVDYGIDLTESGEIYIYESGWFQGVFGHYQAGDVFRVEVVNSQVRYRKNGQVFHSSLTLPTYPLGLDTSLIHEGGTITAARVASCTGEVNCMPQEMWKNVRYATATDGILTRGPGNGDYSGASSVQQIGSGDGFVEFSTNETNRDKIAGLGHGDESQNVGDIDYGIYLTESGDIWIYENGWFQGLLGHYQAGDVFRVEVVNSQVRYRKNGEVFHSSLTPPTYPLGLDTSLIHEGATITAARVASCANEVNCMPQEMWKNVRYATASGSALTRGPGNGDYSGASSVQQIGSGDGFVEFSTNETNRDKIAGLGHGDESQNVGDIDYGIYLTESGDIWIYENGWFQGLLGHYQAGDVFRVEVVNSQVRYRKNGEVFHSSLTPPTYPLGLDTSLIHEGATITAARVASCANEVNCMPQEMWKNVRYATARGSTLTRGPGNGDYAGASSVEQIFFRDGLLEFYTNETNRAKIAGLNHIDESQSVADIDYGIYLSETGQIRIVESGLFQGEFGNYQPGDVFGVEVLNGQVHYWRNGSLLYVSDTWPIYPLEIDTSLIHEGATVVVGKPGISEAVGDITLEPCPTIISPLIQAWITRFRKNGITICEGRNLFNHKTYVQIVDIRAGARMSISAEVDGASGERESKFVKYTAREWYERMKDRGLFGIPRHLFSVTNAPFAKMTSSELSFPLRVSDKTLTLGSEQAENPLRILGLGDPRSAGFQGLVLQDWDNSRSDIEQMNALDSYFEAIVAFTPDAASGSGAHTYVGIRSIVGAQGEVQDRAYVLVTEASYAPKQVQSILQDVFHVEQQIQLDGGGSTQLYTEEGIVLESDDERAVYGALLVYEADGSGGGSGSGSGN